MPNFADVSHHQTSFDVKTYALHRQTVALKATEGTGFTDPKFKVRWQSAKGLRRIAYHFARAKFDGADEFAHCWAVVRNAGFDPSTDTIALDVEDPDTPRRALANAQEFVHAAVSAGVTTGLIYTYPNYAVVNKITANAFPVGWRRLWYANYSAFGDTAVKLPPGWDSTQYVARQYSDKVMVPGVGLCDDNRILRDWLTPIPGDPKEEDTMAGWSDQDSNNLATVADWVQRTYRSGFASVNPDGTLDPTHESVSVRGTNELLGAINSHLGAIHSVLDSLAGVLPLSEATPVDPGSMHGTDPAS